MLNYYYFSFLLYHLFNKQIRLEEDYSYSTLISLAFSFGACFSFMLSSNMPFVYIAFAELSSNSTSTGMSVWYFLSSFSACTVTYLPDTFTLISSLLTPGISAVTLNVFCFSSIAVSTKGALTPACSIKPLADGLILPNSLT